MKNIIWIFMSLCLLSSCNQAKEKTKKCCTTESKGISENTAQSVNEESIYQLDTPWMDQNGQSFQLLELLGKPIVMTMIFTNCEYACPLMVSDLKKIEAQFSAIEKEKFLFVLVSFDDIRDTPQRLKEYATAQGLGVNWLLLHGNADQIKDLSVVLNISYEKLSNGSFAHANRKLLLNNEGLIVYAQDGLETENRAIIEALKSAI